MPVGHMISHFTGSRATRAAGGVTRLLPLIMALLAAAWRERTARRAIVELNAQDDFVLLDLGIRRDQIEAAVRKGRFDLERPRPLPRRR